MSEYINYNKKEMVSIIVPIYEASLYLEQCIESLIRQTYQNIEIILVDDGSRDSSPQICDRYALKDARVHVIHKENAGSVLARKDGLQRAEGKFILFVDSDDWIEKSMVEDMLSKQRECGADIVICGFIYENRSSSLEQGICVSEGYYNKKDMENDIYPIMLHTGKFGEFGLPPSLWAKLFRREHLQYVIQDAPSAVSLGEDAIITYPFMLRAENCYVMKKALYHYRINENSMTMAYNKRQTRGTTELIQYLKKSFEPYSLYGLSKQLDQYHCFIAARNVVNIGRAGFCSGWFGRLYDWKKFIHDTELYSVIRRCDIAKMEMPRQIYLGFWLLRLRCPSILILIYCIWNSRKRR